eukprot:4889186-Lingulodinium_polyedra.AAC.1
MVKPASQRSAVQPRGSQTPMRGAVRQARARPRPPRGQGWRGGGRPRPPPRSLHAQGSGRAPL